MKRILSSIIRFFNKKVALRNIQLKNEIIKNFDSNEERLFELFRTVLKNHTFLYKDDKDREVGSVNMKILITQSFNSLENKFIIRKENGVYIEMFVDQRKSSVFMDEFDKYTKKKSIKYQISKRKEINNFLNNLIEIENRKS